MLNLLAYTIYLLITYLITVRVGWILYRNGRIYLLALLNGDNVLTDSINRVLLVGYYLLNLGYAALIISRWQTVENLLSLVESIVWMTGRIVLSLGLVHYLNMAVIYAIGFRRKSIHHLKS